MKIMNPPFPKADILSSSSLTFLLWHIEVRVWIQRNWNISTNVIWWILGLLQEVLKTLPKRFTTTLKDASLQGKGTRFQICLSPDLFSDQIWSSYTSVDHIKEAILLLEVIYNAIVLIYPLLWIFYLKGRLTNIYDVPIHAPWLFIEPDLTTGEAQNMLKKISRHQFRKMFFLLAHFSIFHHFFLEFRACPGRNASKTFTNPWWILERLRFFEYVTHGTRSARVFSQGLYEDTSACSYWDESTYLLRNTYIIPLSCL